MVDDEGVIIIRAGDYKLRGETVAAKREAEKGGLDRRARQEKIIFAMGDPHSRVAELDALDIDVMGVTIPPFFYFYGIERRSEEHTSELQSIMRISYAVFCLKKKNRSQQS